MAFSFAFRLLSRSYRICSQFLPFACNFRRLIFRMFSAIAQMIFRQEFVTLGSGTDVIIEGGTAAVQLGEIPK